MTPAHHLPQTDGELEPTARILVTGGRGTGKSETAQNFANQHGGLYLPVSPHAQISGLATSVADEIALGLEQHVTGREELTRRVRAIAAALGIENLLDADPLKLSGGQTQLAVLASLLALGAPVLALDEPLLGLDSRMKQRVLAALGSYDGAVLWTAARPTPAERALAARVIELEAEAVGVDLPCTDITLPTRQPLELTARSLALSPLPPARRRWGRAALPPTPIQTGLNLTLAPGETLLLTGANGSGKSTLLRSLAGLLPPAGGTVTLGGVAPADLPAPQRVRRVQLIAQSPAHHFLAPSVAGELTLGAGATSSKDVRTHLLTATGLTGHENTHPLDLLPAEQHLLTLASALAGATPCLLLDEPTERLDERGVRQLLCLLDAHRAAGGSAIIATHDPALHTHLPRNTLHLT